ncbi:MAG TPA: cytochrome c maturation protein CcmE [bacterium]|jgi:cytochrome c-type biogenesis protein CcmE|nr:cytochrome c maturation protein CcmE [bacterium]
MTPSRKLAVGLAVIAVAIAIVAYNGIRSAAVYYLTPSEFAARPDLAHAQVRLAGTVVPGSLVRADGRVTGFRITDATTAVAVRYDGPLPDLFAEGREVLVEGRLAADGALDATQVITTHPTEYKERTGR